MAHLRGWLAVLTAAVLAGPAAAAAPADDARALAARIDELIAARREAVRVPAAPPADDAAFLRRLSLDVSGRIPTVAEVRGFLRDPASGKRELAVDRLLDSPGYVNLFGNVWRDLLIPEANADFQQRFLSVAVERWLRERFANNVPFDRMVRELLTVELPKNRRNLIPTLRNGPPSPLAFYLSKQGKPENLAASTSRLFLGVRLECAQCHNHPFGRWTREQFWAQAAFFAGIRPQGNNGIFVLMSERVGRRELPIPGTERVAQARFLDDSEPRLRYNVSARAALADWMTSANNPYFARAIANRVWAQLFGVGIVEPVDDLNDENAPSHPELLDELARGFVRHGFDLKFLVRAITLSKTYQQSSVHPTAAPPDVRLFARMPVKGLTQDQLLDSLLLATATPGGDRTQRRFSFNTPQGDLLARFTSQDRPTEYQTSIPQALALMNGKLIAAATHPDRSEYLASVAAAPFLDTDGRIEALFLAALSRRPRPDELAKYRRHVESGGAARDPKAALADVFWVLLNSPEFFLNH